MAPENFRIGRFLNRSNRIPLIILGTLLVAGALALVAHRLVRDVRARFEYPAPVFVVSGGGPGGVRKIEIQREVVQRSKSREFETSVADWTCRDWYVEDVQAADSDGPGAREGFDGTVECWNPADAASRVSVDFRCAAFDGSWLAVHFGLPGVADSVSAVRMRLVSGAPAKESAVEIEVGCRYAKPAPKLAGR